MSTVVTVGPDEAMHLTTIEWQRGQWTGVPGKYSREHLWRFAQGLKLKVTDPLAPAAYRDQARLDPLAFVATLSSAYMLSWLHAAFCHGVEVERYIDPAEGVLSEASEGEVWVSEVILKPGVTFSARQVVEPSAVTHFHELAMRHCFIARSVRTKITIRHETHEPAPRQGGSGTEHRHA